VFELSSQPRSEPATNQRDLQHGVGWTFERQASVVYEYGESLRSWSDCSERELHDDQSFGQGA
jgi:hypothetical protein